MPFCFDILYQHFKIKSMTEYSLKAHWTAQIIFFNCSQRLQNVMHSWLSLLYLNYIYVFGSYHIHFSQTALQIRDDRS